MQSLSQETVIVRDRDGMRQLEMADFWTTLTLIAALSSDPRNFGELARAWWRYRPDELLEDRDWRAWPGMPPQGAWFLLDLACQRLAAGGGAEIPDNPAAFQRDEGSWTRESPLVWINFPPHWQCLENVAWPQALAELPAVVEPFDPRLVLFGPVLAKDIARRTLATARSERLPAEYVCPDQWGVEALPTEAQRAMAAYWYELTVQIHAAWLMTPRDELRGNTPRHFLHRGRDWVDRELQNRQLQWSHEGRAPRPLDRDTYAYRYGPLGTHEVVIYFDFCREVIGAAWQRLAATPGIADAALAEVLAEHARWWLAAGSIDDEMTSPTVIIEKERRHLPLVADASHFDCDCPLCRMQIDGDFGPAFTGFDGHHLELDNEFAFSLCETREEWEEEQQEYRRFADTMDAKQQQRGTTDELSLSGVWSRSFIDPESFAQADSSSPFPILALATRVAELISDLQTEPADRESIDALNSAFDAYRAAQHDGAMAATSREDLATILERIASAHPTLTPKASDLQSLLDEWQRARDAPL